MTQPTLNGLIELLPDLPWFAQLIKTCTGDNKSKSISINEGAWPYVIAGIWHHYNHSTIILCETSERARHLHDSLTTYIDDSHRLLLFPEPDTLPYERLSYDKGITNQRISTLADLYLHPNVPNPPLIISSVSSMLQRTLSKEIFENNARVLSTGNLIRLTNVLEEWVSIGYSHVSTVEVPGTFSHRGGIIDVFSPSSSSPTRIELIGDAIENIRLFDPSTQRSLSPINSVTIVPAKETLPNISNKKPVMAIYNRLDFSNCESSVKERMDNEISMLLEGQEILDSNFYTGFFNNGNLLDYIDDTTLLIIDEPSKIQSHILSSENRNFELRETLEANGDLPRHFPERNISWGKLKKQLKKISNQLVKDWTSVEDGPCFTSPNKYHGDIGLFINDLITEKRKGTKTIIATSYAARIADLCREHGLETQIQEAIRTLPEPNTITLVPETISEGWTMVNESNTLSLFSDSEIWGKLKQRRRRANSNTSNETKISIDELQIGGYIVHVDHGIAKFTGTTHIGPGNDQKEFLILEYAGNDKIYVPTDHLSRVSRYVSSSDQDPVLTNLSTTEWSRAKEKVKHSTREMAKELLRLSAERASIKGIAYSPDSVWQQELEDSFPYKETTHQHSAIMDVKEDMEQNKPMDRIICGDVGYGKTEVAVRAAFKAVQDGYQVSILVPTTILAQQHYSTFTERLRPFPVKISVLSRLLTQNEQAAIIGQIRDGTVDIVIGTHRLLQKDIRFKKLGLAIVDEEQRFGVTHKESLKTMRSAVDILTLSATPIPRTLHMALAGIREMSTIATPPEERLTVKTYISEYSDAVVKEAIIRELERGGQVFFLHNRIKSINNVAENIRSLVPSARVSVCHGQMPEGQLENVMMDFTSREIDVLCCTTIIEAGLDLPRANTLIIDRADRLGLSQLYQIRGRVGRASQRAHCYLFIPHQKSVTQTAEKRLNAIMEASELGSGFKIAMQDLEIRGAGNILGPEQSGYMHAVGFELYNQLLHTAVEEIKSAGNSTTVRQPPNQPVITIPLSAYIPNSYISNLSTRLVFYKKLALVQTLSEIDEIRHELTDRFGALPIYIENLLYVATIKFLAIDAGVKAISKNKRNITITLDMPVRGAAIALEKALGHGVNVGNQQIRSKTHEEEKKWKNNLIKSLEGIKSFREKVSGFPR